MSRHDGSSNEATPVNASRSARPESRNAASARTGAHSQRPERAPRAERAPRPARGNRAHGRRGVLLPQLLVSAVESRGDAVAVVAAEGSLSYRELD